jgi:hypothetical protein
MLSRGQTSLDLVLALVVVIVGLSILAPVQSRFLSTQNELSLRHELRANAATAGNLITQAGWYAHASTPYAGYNSFSYFGASLPTFRTRAMGKPQGFSCTPSIVSSSASGVQDANIILSLPAVDTGLAQDIVEKGPAVIPPTWVFVVPNPSNLPSRLQWDACDEPIQVGSA